MSDADTPIAAPESTPETRETEPGTDARLPCPQSPHGSLSRRPSAGSTRPTI